MFLYQLQIQFSINAYSDIVIYLKEMDSEY